MRTRAAVLWQVGEPWQIEEIDLDPPGPGEVLVRVVAAGLCHSDEHVVTGDLPFTLPIVGGHEGAGVVEAVGAGVTSVDPGDHVVFSFIPACGRCPACATGRENLCDLGAHLAGGRQIADGTSRHHVRGTDLGLMCLVGTFAEHTVVHESSCVAIDASIPLDRACLLGCGAVTGWGSAVYAANVRAGDTVVVVGIGGIGGAAVQGARMAGAAEIVAVDPVDLKQKLARELGATATAASMAEARDLVRDLTWGRMADKVILSMGVGRGELVADAMALTGKGGRVVVTNLHPWFEEDVKLSLLDMTLYEKQLVGSLFGSANPRADIPRLARLWQQGRFDLDALVTRTYPLDGINDGYAAMRAGTNLRAVLLVDGPTSAG